MALSHPDILLAGATDAGVNGTPDEVAFAAQRVGYYTKYPTRPAHGAVLGRPDPAKLARQPKFANGEGSTVFWTTGSCLLKHGENKEQAAEYIKAPPTTRRSGRTRSPAPRPRIRAMPLYSSLYAEERLARLDARVRRAGAASSTRPRRSPTTCSACSSSSSAAVWETYLKGEEQDPRRHAERHRRRASS